MHFNSGWIFKLPLNDHAQYSFLSNYNWLQKSDNDLSEFVTDRLSGNAKDEYLHRRQMLREKLDGNSDKLSQEILRLEQNIVELNDKHLHQIITRENIDNVFSISNTNEIGITTNFNDIKGSEYFDLLKYLIRDGYIDESYADYMTYFYENSLSRVDKTFLRSVTDKKAKEYTYKLKNPQLVVSRLRLADFGQEETLNFDLLTYLLKENSRFNWNIHSDLNQRMQDLSNYHRKVRKDLFYIYGDTKLWYLKKNLPNNTHVLQRNSLTLIFAVMHWMSELVRYNPQKFEKLMESKQNWLLHEFIEKALYQFVDEISCEITHQEIMTTGYRK